MGVTGVTVTWKASRECLEYTNFGIKLRTRVRVKILHVTIGSNHRYVVYLSVRKTQFHSRLTSHYTFKAVG